MKEQTGQFGCGAPARPWPARRSDRSLYGWRTLESQQWQEFAEAVTGFIKLDSKISESILKLSGAKGVFFEPLAKHRIPTNISWILQNKEETDQEYLGRILSQDHTNGFTYRRQGKSRLGLRNPNGSVPPINEKARVWEA